MRGKMSTPMIIDAMASAAPNPVRTITSPATMTAAEPAKSLSTSRKAPRALRLWLWASRRSHSDAPLPASPTRATAIISPDATSAG